MKKELRLTEIEREIENQLEGRDAEWWNGADDESRNEYFILAQRDGLDAAIEELTGIGD